jgi:hypothetical protein
MLAQMGDMLTAADTSADVPPIMLDSGLSQSQIMANSASNSHVRQDLTGQQQGNGHGHGHSRSHSHGMQRSGSQGGLQTFGSGVSGAAADPSEPDSPGSVRTVIYHPHGRSNLGAGQGKGGQREGAQEDGADAEEGVSGLRSLSSRALNVTIKAGQWVGSVVGRGGGREQSSDVRRRQSFGLVAVLLVLVLQLVLLGAWWHSSSAAARAQQQQQQQRIVVMPQEAGGMPGQASYWLQHMQHLQQEMALLQSRMDLVSREMQAAVSQLAVLSQQQQQPGGGMAAAAAAAGTVSAADAAAL